MSRIGKQPVVIPGSVKVKLDNNGLLIEGPKGRLQTSSFPGIKIVEEEKALVFQPLKDDKKTNAMHGLARAHVANMVKGVVDGFTKKLEIIGIGYRVQAKGNVLDFTIGRSHQVLFEVPRELQVKVLDQTHFELSGIDKQLLGQVAANIRALYPPEPYKGKGIRYEGEQVRRKTGKSVG